MSDPQLRYPLIAPQPPRLETYADAIRRMEASGIYSNNGPLARSFEASMTERLFEGTGATLAVANATLGLMLAIREAIGDRPAAGRFALMPALTFAATAQAAIWAGLTPLICDIDPEDWAASRAEEERLLRSWGDRIAVVVPYATFGASIDLDHYAALRRRHGVGVVIDAAASLGSLDGQGRAFGADAPFAVVFSMHATKPFAVGEGGLIHSADADLIERLRIMANFGFGAPRTATVPGLNAKLPELLAAVAAARLEDVERVSERRVAVTAAYAATLDGLTLQRSTGRRQAAQFMPALLPAHLAPRRDAIIAALAEQGVGAGHYFSPHLAQHPWLADHVVAEPLPVTDEIAARIISLPVTDSMTSDDAATVSAIVNQVLAQASRTRPAQPRSWPVAETLMVGGGPAGTAVLTAASKAGLLPAFSQGLVVAERGPVLGEGRLGRYAITSDSTAQTFLTAVENNPHAELARLADHPAALAVARYRDALGVPLVEVGPLLRATGDRLGALVTDHGGEVLTGHEVLGSQYEAGGIWLTRLRRLQDGADVERRSRNLVIATGGHQPLDRLTRQQVAGVSLTAELGDRLLQSDEVLAVGGAARVADLLSGRRAPRIAVIGGSTSALTTVALLLKAGIPLGAGALSLLHRRPLRPFYPSREAALAERFEDFGPEDICPVSGFVYRLAGFRLEARELVLRMLSVDGRAPDPRVSLHRLAGEDDPAARDLLMEADLVIAALGYRPRALPLSDARGRPITLAAHSDRGQMVDGACRVLDAQGHPLPGLFGIGLAAGFLPSGPLGGEPSFSGQANGLWLWQNDVGRMLVDQVLVRARRHAA